MPLTGKNCIFSGKRIGYDFLCCTVIFLYILILTAFCPYVSDDLHFKFVWLDFLPCGIDRRISGLSDIFESMKNYYLISGGRVFCHFLAYLFLYLDKWVFNVLNAAMFTVLGLLLHRMLLGDRNRERYPFLLPLLYLLLFFRIPAFGDDVLWLSGSVNYLWPSVLLLLAAYESDRYFAAPSPRGLFKVCVSVFFSSFTNEITGGMLAVLLTIHIVAGRKRRVRHCFLPLVCTIPGLLFILSSPGNASRAKAIEHTSIFSLPKILELLPKYISSLFSDTGSVILFFLFVAYAVYFLRREGFLAAVFRCRYFIAGFAGLAALAMCGAYIRRPVLFAIMFVTVSYGETSLFFYEKIIKEPRPLFGGVLNIKNIIEGVVLFLSVWFCILLFSGTVRYLEIADSFRRYDAALREYILTNEETDESISEELYESYGLYYGGDSFLFPAEAASGYTTNSYRCAWYILYCRSEEPFPGVISGG